MSGMISEESSFQDEFVAALSLPHACDPFPTLQGILPSQTGESEGRPRRERIRSRIQADSN